MHVYRIDLLMFSHSTAAFYISPVAACASNIRYILKMHLKLRKIYDTIKYNKWFDSIRNEAEPNTTYEEVRA